MFASLPGLLSVPRIEPGRKKWSNLFIPVVSLCDYYFLSEVCIYILKIHLFSKCANLYHFFLPYACALSKYAELFFFRKPQSRKIGC